LCLVYGLENCVDFLSSAVVLWRFFAPSEVDSALEEKLHRREKRASIGISFILVVLGLSIMVTAFDDLSRGEEDSDELKAVVLISFVSIFIFGALSVFKFHYALALESPSLYKDGICSLIGTVLSGALFINTLIIDKASSVWWIDPIVAVGAGVAAIVIGARALYTARYKEDLPIFNLSWWMLSQGDGTDERTEDKDANGDSIMPQANNNEEESEMV
jgi:divalent metal cation (Fe/Co/Zn/Cd) transporter